MIRLFSYSLSLRLLAIFLLLAALFAWGVVAGIRWAYSADDLRSLISGHLSLHVDYVRQDIGSPPRLDRALAITQRVPVDIRIDGPSVHWSSDPSFPDPASLTFGPSDYFSSKPGALLDELQGVDFAERDKHNYLRFIEGGNQIVVVTPKIATTRDRPPLVPILVGFALLLILGAYLAVRWLFRPLAPIRAGAAYIGAGHFAHRISAQREDELGALASDINAMAGKVEGALEAKRQLLLGVSHELRSPISRLNLGLALLEDSPTVRALCEDTLEMRYIVETLLDAERLGSAHTALDRSDVLLPELAQSLRERFFANEPRLRIQVTGEPRAHLDAARITLMLKNLVGNALRYAPEGPVELTISCGNGEVQFRVRDHGPGIAAGQRAHVGEPFYRPDASRARETGGTGLGLYLARQVARAHGGELMLEDGGGAGALFVAKMPAGRTVRQDSARNLRRATSGSTRDSSM
ncbi:MAG: HAMP domain-containing sensor histidine kinase [Steroidobacteraceae bacterium]